MKLDAEEEDIEAGMSQGPQSCKNWFATKVSSGGFSVFCTLATQFGDAKVRGEDGFKGAGVIRCKFWIVSDHGRVEAAASCRGIAKLVPVLRFSESQCNKSSNDLKCGAFYMWIKLSAFPSKARKGASSVATLDTLKSKSWIQASHHHNMHPSVFLFSQSSAALTHT